MKYELFGTSQFGNVEFLGYYHEQELVLRALDEFTGLGYKRVRYCEWNAR